jgi:acyl dehydratase
VSPVRDTTLRIEDVEVGDALPELEVPLTRTVIVSTAIATRDYQDVHHDPTLAVERGSKDIFMNILSTNGFVGRYVTDWAGPAAVILSIAIRLGAPNYPNDTMVFSGEVTEVTPPSRPGPSESGPYESSGARGTVAVRLQGRNSLGNHVTGTVRISLPSLPSQGGIDVT